MYEEFRLTTNNHLKKEMLLIDGKEHCEDYRRVTTSVRGVPLFIKMADPDAIDNLRKLADNKDVYISVCSYSSPELSANRIYPVYFKTASDNADKTREHALQAGFYASEILGIPNDQIEFVYNGGNMATEGPAAAEIIILIPPIVFGGSPSLLMPAMNYNLARQMVNDGIDVDIDVYYRDYSMPLPNSVHHNKYVIPLTFKELLNLDIAAINELSKNPRPEDSMIIPRAVPDAVEWFAQTNEKTDKEHNHQQQLLNTLLQHGWQIPYCLRFLLLKELGETNGLEACRITARFYAAINANEKELWNYILRWARRNAYTDYSRLKAIISFALENPRLCDCDHPLLRRFCPAGGCFMKWLIEEYEKPSLFENIG